MTTHAKRSVPRTKPAHKTVDGIQVSKLVSQLPEPSLSLYPDRTTFSRTKLIDDEATKVVMLQHLLTGQCLLKRRRPDLGTGRIQHKDLHVLMYVAYVTGQ